MKEDDMRTKIAGALLLCLLMAASVASAQEQQRGRGTPPPLSTDPYNIWPAKQLSTPGRLGNYGHYSASIQRREVGAAPETHTGFSHFLMFTSGEGSVILGGQIVDGPDGKKIIKGGDTHKIVLGEMFHIPINTPHQVVPNAGSSVTYWVTNLNVPK
jgi:mannose-6-phosphate isomerase-like protein (cupin superfamily)